MIALIIVIFALLALSDFPQLIHDKSWYEVTILGGFYLAVMALAVLYASGATLPSPVKGVQNIIVNVLHLGYPKQ